MPCAPCATTPFLTTAGSPAVTGAADQPSVAEGNGAAVDFRGGVTGSEGVVWGHVLARLRARTPFGAVAPRPPPMPRIMKRDWIDTLLGVLAVLTAAASAVMMLVSGLEALGRAFARS